MQEVLLGSWGPQIAAFTKQNPLQVLAVVLTAIGIAITLILGSEASGLATAAVLATATPATAAATEAAAGRAFRQQSFQTDVMIIRPSSRGPRSLAPALQPSSAPP